MYIELIDIKPGVKFYFENKVYEVLNEKSKNPLEIKVFNHSNNRTQSLPRYCEIPCTIETFREIYKKEQA